MPVGSTPMKYFLITLIAGILALTAAEAIICPTGYKECKAGCQNDFAAGRYWTSDFCVLEWQECGYRTDISNMCYSPAICLPPGTPDGLSCCTPYTYEEACTPSYCGRRVSNGCGALQYDCADCTVCSSSTIGAECSTPGSGAGSAYYCGLNSVCGACSGSARWNGTACEAKCDPGENPATAPDDCLLTIPSCSPGWYWDGYTASCQQASCGWQIPQVKTRGLNCDLLLAPPMTVNGQQYPTLWDTDLQANATYYCSDGIDQNDGNSNTGYCCRIGEVWNGASCVSTNQCNTQALCPEQTFSSAYFSNNKCVGQTANNNAPGACCSVGTKNGLSPYYDYTDAAGSATEISNFRIY